MGGDETPEILAREYPPLYYECRGFIDLDDEAPVHRVVISRPFWLGRHEVIVGQFRKFIEASDPVPESIADSTGGYGYNPAYESAASTRGDTFEGRDPRWLVLQNSLFTQTEMNEPPASSGHKRSLSDPPAVHIRRGG